MRKPQILILITFTFLFVLFQNFSVPARVLPVSREFSSNEVSPQGRLGDFVKFQVGDETMAKFEKLKSKLRFEWGGKDEPVAREPASEMPLDEKKDPLQYSIKDLRTLRIRDDNSQLNCRVDSGGMNLVFEQRLSESSSYSIEHNTTDQKSQAKIQFSW